MEKDFNSIAEYWKSAYSSKISGSEKYDFPAHFRKMAGLMAPGKSYYYIVNFHNLELELLSDSIKEFVDVAPSKVDMRLLLSLALPEEISMIQQKEHVIQAFFTGFLNQDEVMDYKVIYTYRMKDSSGKERLMLHQATILSTTSEGRFVHVFSIHTDISHLAVSSTDCVSFVHLKGGKDYLNVCTKAGTFDPQKLRPDCDLKELLSSREVEIVQKMAEGLSSEELAQELYISPYTVRTHRKNILKKTNSKNTTQLITKCIAKGVIQPVF